MLVLPLLAATLLLPLACAETRPAKRLLAELDLIGHPSNNTLPSPFSHVFEGYEHSDCGSRRVKERDALEELLGPALALVNRLDDSGLLCNLRKGPLQHLLQGKGSLGRGIKALLSPSDDHHLHTRSTASERPLTDRIKLVDVDVHWHIVHNSTTGRVPHSTIAAQMHILNTLFNDALALHLTVRSIQYKDNDYLFRSTTSPNLAASMAMKSCCRRGGKDAINIWTVELPRRANGYSTFPEELDTGLAIDGIVVDHRTLPGCSKDDEDKAGVSLIHELGHILGLDHTFSPCDTLGDGVDDTPMQLNSTGYDQGCPVSGLDTCPGPGQDDVSNFMNYAPEECRDHFTPGQLARMRAAATKYRGIPLMDDPTIAIPLSYAQEAEQAKAKSLTY